jgi:ABC-type molybdenum transport system ATPase subunit/photorepair protein PhrA
MEALRLEGIGKRYARKPILEGVSLTVRPGEVYALAGPNGSGKTTLIRLVTGLAFPSQGRALILGEDVHKTPTARRHLGAVVEAPAAFYPYLMALLRALPQVASARIQNGAILFEGDREAVLKALLNEGYRVEALYPQGFDLMAYYQERVKHA